MLYFVSLISMFVPLNTDSYDVFLNVLDTIVMIMTHLTWVTWFGHCSVVIVVLYYVACWFLIKKDSFAKININLVYLFLFIFAMITIQISNFAFSYETSVYLINSGNVNNIVLIDKGNAKILNAGTQFGISNKNEINSFLDYKGINKIEWIYIQNELAKNNKQFEVLEQHKKIKNKLTKTNFESKTSNKIISYPKAKTKGDKGGILILNNDIAVFSDISLSFQQYILNTKMSEFKDVSTIIINKSSDKWTTKGFLSKFNNKKIIVNGEKESGWSNKIIWNTDDYIKLK
ncbi:hypothetical protein [Spiroplasma endosymbiont of Othius punctulatus]|uniref:hypothetical protein n=1 Tax=Spiroplasma endosymbiont of Othius punctulatus TaxID=3066289 RepID=UPI0030CB7C32